MTTPRSVYQIYLETLNAIKRGKNKPTWIMNEIKYSWYPTTKVLASMTQKGLVEYEEPSTDERRKKYRLTSKGQELLAVLVFNSNLIVTSGNDALAPSQHS